MASKVKKFEFRPGPNTYPWDQWLDGSIWKLKQGEDFATDPAKFRTTIYQAARRNNKIVRTSVVEDTVMLQVTGDAAE